MGSVSPESMSSPDSRSARSPFDGDRGGLVAEDQLGERASTYSSAALAAAELTELFEVFSSINEAWKGLDKRGVSTVLNNTVDTGSKRVFTWGSSSRNHAPNDCHSLANRSFSGSRSARWRCWGPRPAGRLRFSWLGQWSRVDNRRALGTFEALVSNRALPLRS